MADEMFSGLEPALQEMMGDPIVQMLMKRDGVNKDALVPLLEQAAEFVHNRQVQRPHA